MKILIATDGSPYTKRVLAYLVAHDEWLGAQHTYTVVHGVAAIPHRAAAFLDTQQVRSYYEDDAEIVFKPIRAFFAMHSIKAKFVLRIGPVAANIAKLAEQGRLAHDGFDRDQGPVPVLNTGAASPVICAGGSRMGRAPSCVTGLGGFA